MEEILKQDKSKSHKEFEKLLSEDLSNRKLKEGEIITGVVSKISEKHIFIDISAKSEGVIPIEEFKLTKEIDKIEIGSKIDVLLEKIEIYSYLALKFLPYFNINFLFTILEILLNICFLLSFEVSITIESFEMRKGLCLRLMSE